MISNTVRKHLLASTVMLSAATFVLAPAAPAFAQQTETPVPSAPPVSPTPVPQGAEPVAPIAPAAGSTAASPTPPQSGDGAGSTANAVVVTGSLIRSPNLTSDAPVTAVSSKELKLEGTTQVEQTLNRLPQFTAEQNQQVANGATGIATLSLRNLGSTRTLVLVDGTRLQPGDPTSSAADVNNIPAALVDRIDVLTGGASATYGSDAVAGVVNFILKKNFQGVQIDTQYGFYNHQQGNPSGVQGALSNFGIGKPGNVDGDGQTWDASILIGANSPDDKGNVTFYAGYRNLQPVTQNSRDFSACALGSTGTGFACAGSSNSSYGRFDGAAATGISNGAFTFGGTSASGAALPSLSLSNNVNGTNAFQRYTGATQSFNYGPYNYLQRADDRYNAGAFAHYKFNDKLEVYGNFMFTDDESFAQIAPSGLFRGTGPNGGSTFTINCDNPLLSSQQALGLCGPGRAGVAGQNYVGTVGYRFLGLPRTDDLRHTDYRINVGARGDIGSGWNYDAYLQYGKSLLSENYQNDVSVSRVQDALLVGRDANGNIACKSVIANGTGGCVPLNIFQAQSTGLTAAQIGYVVTPGFQQASVTEQIAHIQVSGDLGQYGVKSPFSSDGVGVAFGSEYREESLDFRTDAEFASGDLAGQGGPRIGTNGGYDVYELFGEVNVPLVRDVPLIHDLSLDVAYRFSDYSTVGKTDTYKASFSYSPIRDLRFRGGYNRAVRAPNINELFDPTFVNLGSFTDPCSNEGGTPLSFPQCARTGLTQAQYNAGVQQCPAAQCSILIGGNTALKQETADTYTVGFVYQPSWLKGFDISIDAYDIVVSNFIGTIPSTTALNQCTSTGDPFFCSLIHRDPATGSLFGAQGYVQATNVNTGVLQTKGVDVVADYTRRFSDFGLPDLGSFAFNLIGTYTGEQRTKPIPGMEGFDCVGRFGLACGQPTPRWKHELRATWNTPWNVAVSAQWRFQTQSILDLYSANPNLTGSNATDGEFSDPIDRKIGAQSYLDLAVTWRIRDGLNFRGGVNNLLDSDPPVIDSATYGISGPSTFGNGNTFPGVYDSLGRFVFMGITANF